MQTLRKRSSPLKFVSVKNETSRFLGDGVTFKAKLIGILEVAEARGDRMCQEALSDLKMAIRAAGEHKQRIVINVALDGLRLRDEKTGDTLYHHPVHKISFICQDMTDSRAFGYIFGSPDTGHRFFGIKTDKAANQVVIAMRDLFQIVFTMKKREIELAKQHLDMKNRYANTGCVLFPDNLLLNNAKMKTQSKHDGKPVTSGSSVADLVDLELELNSLQQGLHQMERLTPSSGATTTTNDPFGDSFTNYMPMIPPPPSSGSVRDRSARSSESSCSVFSPKFQSNIFDGPSSGGSSDTLSGAKKTSQPDDSLDDWYSTSVFEEAPPPPNVTAHHHEVVKKQILSQFDVFTDLDPLGTGRNKPYIDRKDFFQDLKTKQIPKNKCSEDGETPPPPPPPINNINDFTVDPFGEEQFSGRGLGDEEDPFSEVAVTPPPVPQKPGADLMPPPLPKPMRKTNNIISHNVVSPLRKPPPPQPVVPSDEKELDGATNKIPDITLSQLAGGLSDLAAKLQIPSSQLSCMTIVQLSELLREGATTPSTKSIDFKADFEANFQQQCDSNDTNYDKYAVFRDLINEQQEQQVPQEPPEIHNVDEDNEDVDDEDGHKTSTAEDDELKHSSDDEEKPTAPPIDQRTESDRANSSETDHEVSNLENVELVDKNEDDEEVSTANVNWAVFDNDNNAPEGGGDGGKGASPWSSDGGGGNKENGNNVTIDTIDNENTDTNRNWWEGTDQFYECCTALEEHAHNLAPSTPPKKLVGKQLLTYPIGGGHSSSSRDDISPWEEEPRGAHASNYYRQQEQHYRRSTADSWDEDDDDDDEDDDDDLDEDDDDDEDDVELSMSCVNHLRHHRWFNSAPLEGALRRRRCCCPELQYLENSIRKAGRRVPPPPHHHHHHYYSGRGWDDDVGAYVTMRRSRPSSASEADRKTARLLLATGGSDGEHPLRMPVALKSGRRSRSREYYATMQSPPLPSYHRHYVTSNNRKLTTGQSRPNNRRLIHEKDGYVKKRTKESRFEDDFSPAPSVEENRNETPDDANHENVTIVEETTNNNGELKKSDSVNIFACDNDPFDDDFFAESTTTPQSQKHQEIDNNNV